MNCDFSVFEVERKFIKSDGILRVAEAEAGEKGLSAQRQVWGPRAIHRSGAMWAQDEGGEERIDGLDDNVV